MSNLVEIKGLVVVSTDTKNAWEAVTTPIPRGVLIYEYDTKKVKLGDGVQTYANLDYAIDAVLTSAQKTMLDAVNAANGVLQLDANGKIATGLLPTEFQTAVADTVLAKAAAELAAAAAAAAQDAAEDSALFASQEADRATAAANSSGGGGAIAPQSILKCKMKVPMAAPFNDLALPDFLSFSGLTVTLNADSQNPFSVCFGYGNTSVISEITSNLTLVLGSYAATQWLYLDRNVLTGELTLGVNPLDPEYLNVVRRGTAFACNYAGYTGSLGVVSASTEYAGGGSPAWKAMDGNAVNSAWYTASGVTSGWWRLTLNRKRRLRGYEMVCENDGLAIPRSWNLKITNDGVVTTVDSVTGATWASNERKRRLLTVPVDCDVIEVECLNSGREYTGMTEFVPIFDDDWYSPSENIMRRYDNIQIQRVYIGKVTVSGGAITSVISFAPGVEAIIPVNNGNFLAASTIYTLDNILGVPVDDFTVEGYDTTSSPNYWIPCGLCYTGTQYMGVMTKTANQTFLRFRTYSGAFWWGSNLSSMGYTTTKARIRFRRAF